MTPGALVRAGAALAAAALAALSTTLPLWSMTMRAPQYPRGLRLQAYGTGMTGDLKELNILNHYIGMPPIEAPSFETAVYPYGIALLIGLCLLAAVHRLLRRLAVTALIATPFVALADLQWRLYQFGHSLDPHAPIRLEPFTPHVLGSSTMGNFVSSGMISTGLLCLFAAAAVLIAGEWIARRFGTQEQRSQMAAAAVLGALLLWPAADGHAASLQARIDAARPGTTVTIDGGIHQGPITIRGPLTLVGINNPVIDGGGRGSVVTIEGDDVVLRGFTIRNSGRDVTEEAAGIRTTGSRHRIGHNHIYDVYFGIRVEGGASQLVHDNRVNPGERHGARPGHGISLWHTRQTELARNEISDARDGVYLSFAEDVLVAGNRVSGCRYGLHSMYSRRARFTDNVVADNLLGAALMMSDRLVMRGNRIERHRRGSAAYGVLLKDIGDLTLEDNSILANRVGIYAEAVPTDPSHHALVAGNVIAGNEVGLALQSNAALTISGNRIAENLTDVRSLGRTLSPAARWSRDGRGNSWSEYRGYDADRDGIGDVPHRVESAMGALVRADAAAQAFLYTPAHLALEAAARMFPLFRQAPVLVDERPLTTGASIRGER